MIEIIPYTPSLAPEWDRLVDASRAPSFLLRRGYMDYHADRFTDSSLMAFKSGSGSPIALLPACACGSEVWSHRGLTYGGWVTAVRHVGPDTMLEIFEATRALYRSQGFTHMVYKPIPYIYARYPADDDLYALFRLGASIEFVMASSAFPVAEPRLLRPIKRQAARKALEKGYSVGPSDDYPAAWELLGSVLRERHSVLPVHSLDEITMLAGRFPDEIRLFAATDHDGVMQAMTVVYLTPRVIHTQYMAVSDRGAADGALTLIVNSLPDLLGRSDGWLDFGNCNEDGGRILNAGLARQKAELGGRTVAYTAFSLPL